MKRIVVIMWLAVGIHAGQAHAQTVSAEADMTAGYSTDDIAGVAAQVRAFGDLKAGVTFYLEGAWARRSDKESDAFAAAYPYGGRVQAIETYGERLFTPGGSLIGIRAGRYRTPFGIASRSDYAYAGFIRPPLIRYDDYFALSNTSLEHGADVIVGLPRLYVETSLGAPADVSEEKRRSGLDSIFRVQGYYGAWIVGVSHSRTRPSQPATFAHGAAEFTGIDARWSRGPLLARAEWITGQPFDGTSTKGGYVDLMLHRVAMGPVTAVLRLERLDYDTTPAFALHESRLTVGGKVRLPHGFTAQANLLRQSGSLPDYRAVPIDLGLTYSLKLR